MAYSRYVMNPLAKKKKQDLKFFDDRSDFKQFKALSDLPSKEIFKLRIKIF